MVPIILRTFLPFYFGNEIIEASKKLQSSLIRSNWFERCQRFKTAMMIFMENAREPIRVTALIIFELNLQNFLKILNLSYSLFAVVRSMDRTSEI